MPPEIGGVVDTVVLVQRSAYPAAETLVGDDEEGVRVRAVVPTEKSPVPGRDLVLAVKAPHKDVPVSRFVRDKIGDEFIDVG